MLLPEQNSAPDLLSDRHHGVLLTGVELLLEICSSCPEAIAPYAIHTKTLVKVRLAPLRPFFLLLLHQCTSLALLSGLAHPRAYLSPRATLSDPKAARDEQV